MFKGIEALRKRKASRVLVCIDYWRAEMEMCVTSRFTPLGPMKQFMTQKRLAPFSILSITPKNFQLSTSKSPRKSFLGTLLNLRDFHKGFIMDYCVWNWTLRVNFARCSNVWRKITLHNHKARKALWIKRKKWFECFEVKRLIKDILKS